mmetsp:Transcript_30295/g.100484  ORF Transcript_30295/g.100484 Transcript_30295/m.100484 type:complete len:800 (-) Transcript_30295:727-3126(-)
MGRRRPPGIRRLSEGDHLVQVGAGIPRLHGRWHDGFPLPGGPLPLQRRRPRLPQGGVRRLASPLLLARPRAGCGGALSGSLPVQHLLAVFQRPAQTGQLLRAEVVPGGLAVAAQALRLIRVVLKILQRQHHLVDVDEVRPQRLHRPRLLQDRAIQLLAIALALSRRRRRHGGRGGGGAPLAAGAARGTRDGAFVVAAAARSRGAPRPPRAPRGRRAGNGGDDEVGEGRRRERRERRARRGLGGGGDGEVVVPVARLRNRVLATLAGQARGRGARGRGRRDFGHRRAGAAIHIGPRVAQEADASPSRGLRAALHRSRELVVQQRCTSDVRPEALQLLCGEKHRLCGLMRLALLIFSARISRRGACTVLAAGPVRRHRGGGATAAAGAGGLAAGGGGGSALLRGVPGHGSTKERCLDGVSLREPNILRHDHPAGPTLALPHTPPTVGWLEFGGQHAKQLREHANRKSPVIFFAKLAASIGEDSVLSRVSVQVDVHAQRRPPFRACDHPFQIVDGAVQCLARMPPLTVQVHPTESTAVVPTDDAVRVQHRHDLPHKVVAQNLRLGTRRQQEAYQPMDNPTCIGFSGMHPGTHDDALLVRLGNGPIRNLQQVTPEVAQRSTQTAVLAERPCYRVPRDCPQVLSKIRVSERIAHGDKNDIPGHAAVRGGAMTWAEGEIKGERVALPGKSSHLGPRRRAVVPHPAAGGPPEAGGCASPVPRPLAQGGATRGRYSGSFLGGPGFGPHQRPHADAIQRLRLRHVDDSQPNSLPGSAVSHRKVKPLRMPSRVHIVVEDQIIGRILDVV